MQSLHLRRKKIQEKNYFTFSKKLPLFNEWLIGLVGRVFANSSGDLGSIPGRFIPRYVSRVKWSNPEKRVAPSPTPRYSSYWKGTLLVAFYYSPQHF